MRDEPLGKVEGVRVAARRLGGELGQQRRLGGRVDSRAEPGEAPRPLGDAPPRLLRALCQERVGAGERLPDHHGEREDVGALVHHAAVDLLGRHVAHGAAARVAVARGRGQRRHAKVGELHHTLAVDHDVGRLDVQVQHAVLVREGQGARHPLEHVGALVGCEPAPLHAGEQLREVEAVDVLHDQVGEGAVGLEVKDGDDVGMSEHAGRARLRQRFRGGGARLGGERHALDRHAALQARVPAGADRAKAPATAPLEHAVAAEQVLVAWQGRRLQGGVVHPVGRVAHGVSSFQLRWPCEDILALAGGVPRVRKSPPLSAAIPGMRALVARRSKNPRPCRRAF